MKRTSSCLLPLLLLPSSFAAIDQDLGPIPLGRPAIATFTLPAGPLHLDRVEASCACQIIELLRPNQPPQTLPHRGKLQTTLPASHGAKIRIYVPVQQEGKRRESLRLWLRGKKDPLLFGFRFEGVSPFILSKKSLVFGKIRMGAKTKTLSLEVSLRDGLPYQLLPARHVPRGFEVEARPLANSKTRSPLSTHSKILVHFNPKGLPPGPAGGWIEWKTKTGKPFRLGVSAWVEDPVSMKPMGPLIFGLVPRGKKRTMRVLLKPATWLRSVTLEGLEKKVFSLQWKALPGNKVLVELRLLAVHSPGSFQGKLVIRGNDGSERTKRVFGKVLN